MIAQEHVAEAIRLLLPYVDGKPGPAAQIMSTLVHGAAITLQREIDENQGQQWGVHYDDEVVRGDVEQALKKHVEATRELTTALLERRGFEPCGHIKPQRGGQTIRMKQPFVGGAVGFGLDGVDGAGGATGEKIEQRVQRLLKAPRPEVARIAGKASAPLLVGAFPHGAGGRILNIVQRGFRGGDLQAGVA